MGCGASTSRELKFSRVLSVPQRTVCHEAELASAGERFQPFRISKQVGFDDSMLEIEKSWDLRGPDTPRNVALAPGRQEHERNHDRVKGFMQSIPAACFHLSIFLHAERQM